MSYENIKKVHEICTGADFNDSASIVKEVNECLSLGWVILAIHQRGWDFTDSGSDARQTTVYVLGHTSPIASTDLGTVPF